MLVAARNLAKQPDSLGRIDAEFVIIESTESILYLIFWVVAKLVSGPANFIEPQNTLERSMPRGDRSTGHPPRAAFAIWKYLLPNAWPNWHVCNCMRGCFSAAFSRFRIIESEYIANKWKKYYVGIRTSHYNVDITDTSPTAEMKRRRN